MDYVLYTSNATHWNLAWGKYDPPTVEFVFFKDADQCSVLEEIFAVNDAMQGLCFWLGADAEDV